MNLLNEKYEYLFEPYYGEMICCMCGKKDFRGRIVPKSLDFACPDREDQIKLLETAIQGMMSLTFKDSMLSAEEQ